MKREKKFITFDRKFWKILLYSVILVLLICVLLFILNKWCILDSSVIGKIGDTIGGIIGTLVAMIVAYFAYRTFIDQSDEYRHHRDDIAKERFERHVFEMLNAQEQITSGLVLEVKKMDDGDINGGHYNKSFFTKSVIDNQIVIKIRVWVPNLFKSPHKENKDNRLGDNLMKQTGRDVFQLIYEDAPLEFESHIAPLKVLLNQHKGMRYIMADEKHIWFLDHYFRHLYRIYKYIDEYDEEVITPEMKKEYAGIVRSHLSPYELVMIFYNSFTKPKFAELIVKYKVLENIRMDLLAADEDKETAKEMNKSKC